jgi:tRNA splicing endonuclease
MPRKKSKTKLKKTSNKVVNALFLRGEVITEISPEAKEFYDQSRLGDLKKTGKVHLSLIEGLFLIEKKRLNVFDGRNHLLTEEEYLRKAVRQQPKFLISNLRILNY